MFKREHTFYFQLYYSERKTKLMRKTEIKRTTGETDISVVLDIDGTGSSEINSGCGFFDHMLTLFAKHGHFDLKIICKGDTACRLSSYRRRYRNYLGQSICRGAW